ncbi:uncharacterized protein At2g33490-like isoform X1 [Zingiber officinale]|nr:uncharacterized protein At2g33490-like isoform X1 [Zingiber officinale]
MKSPLRIFRGLKLNKEETKEAKHQRRPSRKPDDFVQATQDMQDMRNCYDSLLSAAATTANNAHEFSEALEELGTCLLEKAALNDDEDSSRALMMMGKSQFELQKLFGSYRTNILHTMDKPSRSLLKEIENLEEMKRLCDGRRELYKNMLEAHRGKGRSKHSKENSSAKELQEAQANYEDEAAWFVFRLQSLKKGQFQSLLTQATRHHAAQLNFFRKGLKTLEMVEPQVKTVANQHHIDYNVNDLEDDGSDNDDDNTYGSDDEDLSFEYQKNFLEENAVSTFRNTIEENTDKSSLDTLTFSLRPPYVSQSAPIFADKKVDLAENKETLPAAARKFHSYVLPMPLNDRNQNTTHTTASHRETKDVKSPSLWYSSPLEAKIPVKDVKESELPNRTMPSKNKILGGRKIYSDPTMMPSYFSEKPSVPQSNRQANFGTTKYNRQAFSGPLTSKPFSSRPIISPAEYRHTTKFPPVASLASQWMPKPQSSTPQKVAPRTSLPVPSPMISELHELPRPPIGSEKMTGPAGLIGYSGPLVSRNQAFAVKNNMPSSLPGNVHPLPTPLGQMSRSFSIPANSQRIPLIRVSRLLETPQNTVKIEEITSPPITPSPAMTTLPVSTTS